jgi:glycosyltransferase involved in cell wall biosynthesis
MNQPSTDQPLRLAYLTYRGKPHVGGQGVYTRHLTKALADLGHHVEVFSGQPYPILDERVELHQMPSLDIWNDHYPGRMPSYWEIKTKGDIVEAAQFMTGTFSEPLAFSVRILDVLKKRKADFDIVHDNQCLGYGMLAVEKMMPTIVTLHHPITRDRQLEVEASKTWRKKYSISRWYGFVKMQGRVASRMPRIVVVSENSIKDIHTDMGVSLDRMRLVPVGVDIDLFKPQPHVARKPGHLITTASADVALKGLEFLLEAIAKVRTERADLHLTVIGRAKPGGHSALLIERLGLSDCIEFVTGVPDERIVELYAESELAVVPSLYEGFSLPAVEAMATGICLVATDGGALPEVTGKDNDTVLGCRAGDAEDLAAALRRGLADIELRARIGEAGRQRVVERWSWGYCAQLTVDQYREVLAMPSNQAKLRANGR